MQNPSLNLGPWRCGSLLVLLMAFSLYILLSTLPGAAAAANCLTVPGLPDANGCLKLNSTVPSHRGYVKYAAPAAERDEASQAVVQEPAVDEKKTFDLNNLIARTKEASESIETLKDLLRPDGELDRKVQQIDRQIVTLRALGPFSPGDARQTELAGLVNVFQALKHFQATMRDELASMVKKYEDLKEIVRSMAALDADTKRVIELAQTYRGRAV